LACASRIPSTIIFPPARATFEGDMAAAEEAAAEEAAAAARPRPLLADSCAAPRKEDAPC